MNAAGLSYTSRVNRAARSLRAPGERTLAALDQPIATGGAGERPARPSWCETGTGAAGRFRQGLDRWR